MATSRPAEATSVQHAAAQAQTAPQCPVCGSAMVVRPTRHGGLVGGLYWGCRRELVCNGTRKIRDPNLIVPLAHDAGTMAIFEWERSRDRRGWARPVEAPQTTGGLRGILGRAIRPTNSPTTGQAAISQADSPLDGLVDYGFVILDDRRVASARSAVDHLVIGPTGIFIVDRKTWRGQISASSEAIYVDGRQRTGATDDALRARAAVEQVLAHELKPLGATIQPVLVLDGATNRAFEATVGKVLAVGARSLARRIRAGQPTLGPETVVRLSLAADRLLD